jgi:hypothetical protein
MSGEKVHLVETLNYSDGLDFERVWMVEPPPEGVRFFVTESYWTADCRQQTVTAWREVSV